MTLNNKIRKLREMNNLSQEQMAERVSVSKNTYGKIERGESQLTIEILGKISQVFDMDMVELIDLNDRGLVCLFAENHSENNNGTQYGNFYQSSDNLMAENEKLQLTIKHNEEMLAQKDMLINVLQRENALLREKINH